MTDIKKIAKEADKGNRGILKERQVRTLDLLPAKYLAQYAHLSVPATVWKYIEKAPGTGANLVMLDLEDSTPRDNRALLNKGRENIIRAFTELDWGNSIKTFRPRGL